MDHIFLFILSDHDTALDAQGQPLQPTAQITSKVKSDVRQPIGDTENGLGITATIGLEAPEV